MRNYSFVIGQQESSGEISDVRIKNNAEGLTEVTIARDPMLTGRRIYIVDRRVLPDGSWMRLFEVESFSENALPDRLSEVRADIEFEEIVNDWSISFEKCWGLPSGMESPWIAPIEMVKNELLLEEKVKWVSGDAPVNIVRNNMFENGKYGVTVGDRELVFTSGGETLGVIETDTRGLSWTEGIAGAASFRGGYVYIEPAKPATFTGSFVLDRDPIPVAPGLYEYGDFYLISSTRLNGKTGVGTISFLKDPFPERWVSRMMGRAYTRLISPANKPPLTEDEPERISVRVEYPETDFPDLTPEIVTPYSDKTGTFNAWEPEGTIVKYDPLERPYDVYLPMIKEEDWGGHTLQSVGDFYPANDFLGTPSAAFPQMEGFEIGDLPPIVEGAAFFRWRDSAQFSPIRSTYIDIEYREGYIYFTNRANPRTNGIAKINVEVGWNHTKLEWYDDLLFINDKPALQEEREWGEYQNNKWVDLLGYNPASSWEPDYSIPMDEEQYEEIPPTWMTGLPEEESEREPLNYIDRPKTWGRVLFEKYESPEVAAGEEIGISEIADLGIGEV